MSAGPTGAETTALLLESTRLLGVDEYHRMIAAGILDEDERVELVEGVIVATTPRSPAHARCIRRLNRLLVRRLGLEPDAASGTYRRTRSFTTAETLASEALPEIFFPAAELFG